MSGVATFPQEILSFLMTLWWLPVVRWEASQKSHLHGLAAEMAYIMDFTACGGLLELYSFRFCNVNMITSKMSPIVK